MRLCAPALASHEDIMYKRVYTSENIMSEAVLEIKTWGNSLGVRIPSAVARAARLRANQPVKTYGREWSRNNHTGRPRNRSRWLNVFERYDPVRSRR